MDQKSSTQNNRILVIDDNQAIHDDIRKVLNPKNITDDLDALTAQLLDGVNVGNAAETSIRNQPDYQIESALQGREGVDMAYEAKRCGKPFALAFVDMRMPPGWDGLETIENLWHVDPDIQVVICSAYSDYSFDEINDRLDRTDQLLILRKPFDSIEVRQLAIALVTKWEFMCRARLTTSELERMVAARTRELQKTTELLKHNAFHDVLTDLPNRALLKESLDRSIKRTKRDSSYKFAIIFLDLDNFKIINDSMGHTVGDQLLCAVATRIKNCLRGVDTAVRDIADTTARLGGDEFVIVLDEVKEFVDSELVAERVKESLAVPFLIENRSVSITASMGIVTSQDAEMTTETLMRDADLALYSAKKNGKNGYVMFDESMRKVAVARLEIENELREAIANEQLTLVYQPIVSVRSQRLLGFEALVRWNHPTRGLVSPVEFIPIAEECGLIHSLGMWVLKTACRQIAEWHKAFPMHPNLTVSVNLSSQDFAHTSLPGEISKAIADNGLQPDTLRIEITESILMQDVETVNSVLEQLKETGINLYMDDFGTGYSSLSYLHQLPVDVLKVDRSFVSRLSDDKKHRATVEAVITLAHNQGIKVVAEGVEEATHVKLLRDMKCDMVQGYYYSRPLAPADVEELLANDDPFSSRDAA